LSYLKFPNFSYAVDVSLSEDANLMMVQNNKNLLKLLNNFVSCRDGPRVALKKANHDLTHHWCPVLFIDFVHMNGIQAKLVRKKKGIQAKFSSIRRAP
jgi:hypothetical protein